MLSRRIAVHAVLVQQGRRVVLVVSRCYVCVGVCVRERPSTDSVSSVFVLIVLGLESVSAM